MLIIEKLTKKPHWQGSNAKVIARNYFLPRDGKLKIFCNTLVRETLAVGSEALFER